MKTGAICPQPEELRQLLNSSLSGERSQECTQHLDSCECCQAKLEEIATEGTKLSQVVMHLKEAEPMATSAYWPALKALETDVSQTTTPLSSSPQPGVRTRDVSLAFLQPPSDTVYLGRLAQFDVMRVLGRGGMGVVLEAFDSRLQRNVAIKVLDPELAGDEIARQRFCREARAAASISHENVVAVHQVEKAGEEGLPYLVMQVINGESLEQRLTREGRLPLREIVRIGMQASHGLAAAHAQGLIHRDIKPGNILLEAPQDRVKLTDFGLARVAEDVKLTRTGYVSGTPLYMAPEQALDEPTDHRADLFSLGAILYEMCAGHPPFTGNSVLVILRQIADTKHRPLREIDPTIPQWLSETIDRLLAKKPADRIQTAAELAELFDFHWALMKTTSEELPSVCQVAVKKRQRRNLLIASGVGASFLALGLLGGMFLANRRGSAAIEPVSTAFPIAVLQANAGAVWSVSFDPTSKTVAMGVEDGKVRLWDLATQRITSTIDASRGAVWNARFAPNAELLATSGNDGQIKIWKPSQNEAIKTFKQNHGVRGLAFAHDGKSLYAGDRDGELRLWSLDADEPLAQAKQEGEIYAVAVSPDGETLAAAGNGKVVQLWNAKSLTPKISLEGHNGPINGLAFHPDGHQLASVGWDSKVRIWDVASGELLHTCSGHGGEIWGVAFSPDGSMLATGGFDGAVRVWNTEKGKLMATFLGHKAVIHTVAFNSDGKLLASGGRDGAVRVWEIEEE
ncbi:MAG TPA: serine/threonine-protein kinase [Pirellulales bacterium]|jgi:WD40 repeat protein